LLLLLVGHFFGKQFSLHQAHGRKALAQNLSWCMELGVGVLGVAWRLLSRIPAPVVEVGDILTNLLTFQQ
jgi:hypothetical protein